MEPTSTGTSAVSLFAWKAIGGLAGIGAIGAGLATIVVMCLLKPRTQSEWVVGITSTVIGSISGGAAVIMHFGLQWWGESALGLVAMLGLVFACGLPAWAIVRWCFNFFDKRRQADIADVMNEIHKLRAGGQ